MVPGSTTKVIYVSKQNAKVLKTELERLDFLDKRFRMTPAAASSRNHEDGDDSHSKVIAAIAVPVTNSCLSLAVTRNGESISSGCGSSGVDHSLWLSLIEGVGEEEMPLSTSQFAKKKKKKT